MRALGTFLIGLGAGILIGTGSAQAAVHHKHHKHHRKPAVHRVTLPTPPREVRAPLRVWPTFDNVGASAIGDCTFAAAADWEILMGQNPNEAEVVSEFVKFSEGAEELDEEEVNNYWSNHGIGTLKAKLVRKHESELTALVAKAPVYATVNWDNETLAIEPVNIKVTLSPTSYYEVLYAPPPMLTGKGGHALIVAGYNESGPEVITWGHTDQITWAEWERAEPYIFEVEPIS